MLKTPGRILAILALVTLASCGGGGEPAREGNAGVAPQVAALAASPEQPQASAADTAFFSWAERTYPTFFQGSATDGVAGIYTYRFYPTSRNYLGLGNGGVYVLGPISSGALQYVGPLATFNCLVTPGSCPAPVPVPYATSVSATTSLIPVTWPAPVGSALHPLTDFQRPYIPIRNYEVADLNGDGKADIVVCPNYFLNPPQLPVTILLNRGDGKFSDGTAEMIQGVVPTCGVINNIFIRDFNGDGKPDILIIDQGLEDKDASNPGFDGAKNILLASQPGGKLEDVSLTAFPGQARNFNHVSAMGDINGDGKLDVVLARLGGPAVATEGVVILQNDGAGRFTETASRLPVEIRLRTRSAGQVSGVDYQYAGTVGVGDLDGDGRQDIVSASYNYPDVSGKRTVRVYRQSAGGDFAEAARVEIPAAIANIPYVTGGTVSNGINGLGGARVLVRDLNSDGKPDLLVVWEGSSTSYFQILRNDGNWRFTDMTTAWWGGYPSHALSVGGGTSAAQMMDLRDINGDGFPDLVIRRPTSRIADVLNSELWYLNDGTGKFSRWQWVNDSGAPVSAAALGATVGCGSCDFMTFLLADVNGDGLEEPVLFQYTENFPAIPRRATGFEIRTFRASRRP